MNLLLSGPFDTSELPRIGAEPVTVTVGRVVVPGKEAEFEAWAEAMSARLEQFPGSLGAGVLRPGEPGGEYQIVFRFVDALSLRAWERSPQRAAQLREVEGMVVETRVQRTVGVDDWFEAPARAAIRRPLAAHVAIDVAWGFPIVALVSIYLGPRLLELPFEVRTLLSMLVVTTAVKLGIDPIRGRLRRRRRLG
jgi:antibiotic biosynthesis monooxygenase (ABM) superfamily enzyme